MSFVRYIRLACSCQNINININININNIIHIPSITYSAFYKNSTLFAAGFYSATKSTYCMSKPHSESDGEVLQLTPAEVLRLLAYDDNGTNCNDDDDDDDDDANDDANGDAADGDDSYNKSHNENANANANGKETDIDKDKDIDKSNEPLTGETMERLSHRMKADVRCIDVHEFMRIAQRRNHKYSNSNHKQQLQQKMIPICDARSPAEYAIGHIPGAINLPLFTNEERATVGTLFNIKGRSDAMLTGMSIVRPKLDALVSTAAAIVERFNNKDSESSSDADNNNNNNDVLLLHCWRGGMRSCALAFLVQTRIPGLTVYVLKGGYKAFRKWQYNIYCYLPINSTYSDSYGDDDAMAPTNNNGLKLRHRKNKKMTQKQRLKRAVREASASGIGIEKRRASITKVRERDYMEVSVEQEVQRKIDISLAQAKAEADWEAQFSRGPRIAIIGGPTGSGKTKVLLALRDILGEQIIDLEGLANHSGSAFGFVGHEPQPTPQQYTNNVAMEWNSLDPERWVFIEDEGPNVGRVNLPIGLYRKMRTASAVLKLDIPKNIRVEVLREDYALPEKKTREEDCDKSNATPTDDGDVSKWLSSMIGATRTLEKRIGQVKMNSMITMLQDGDYAEFANAALDYYDGLYAKHIANEHGSANMKGNGERAASIATVDVANMERFDAEAVARQVVTTLKHTQVSRQTNTR